MARFDLNLVRAFVAIYETRGVSRAAERLNITQPSVSHALARLRQAYGDHLFVRKAGGLQPTGLATQLYERLGRHLAGIEETLEAQQAFDPATTTRRFRIAISDVGLLALGQVLLQGLHAAAPRSEIEISPITESVLEELAVGRVDVVIGNLPTLGTVTRNQLLFREHYVCLASTEHPGLGEQLTLDSFAQAPHAVISSPSPGNQLIDAALAEHGLARRVTVRTPHFMHLARVVADSRLLAVMPSRVAALHAATGGLRVLDLPVRIPEFEVRLYWHVRSATLKPHAWLVERLGSVLRGA